MSYQHNFWKDFDEEFSELAACESHPVSPGQMPAL